MTLPATKFGSANFLGERQEKGLGLNTRTADLIVSPGVSGEPATITGCIAKYNREYPVFAFPRAVFRVHLPAGFTMEEQVLVDAMDLSHWEITGADAETTIIRSELTTEFETRYPTFGAINGGRLPLIGQLFDMDASGTATKRDGVFVQGAGSVANVASTCGVKNAGANGLDAHEAGLINANGVNVVGAGGRGIFAREASTINANNANASGAGINGIYAIWACTVNADGVNASGAGVNGIFATRATIINAENANARMGETDATTDFRVTEVSIINATGGTGGVSQTAGSYTDHGIIRK